MINKFKEYIAPSGNLEISKNGTYDVLDYQYATIDISKVITDIETEAELDSILQNSDNLGRVFRYTGNTNKYTKNNLYLAREAATINKLTLHGQAQNIKIIRGGLL